MRKTIIVIFCLGVLSLVFIQGRNTIQVEPPPMIETSIPVEKPSSSETATSNKAGRINAALIADAGSEGAEWTRTTPAAHRARIIIPDAALLTPEPSLQEGDRLQLAMFDDAVLDSVITDVTKYPNGAVGMTSKLEGEFKGFLYLSYSGGELRAHADVLGGNDFYIRYEADQQAHVAIEVDRAASGYLDE
ncbi:MAG: hypothetical protein OEL75_00905, partial [Kiritimatiellaceae bacterium]|nr:hypothetical protein [Kiritimatiellaceae bacterium]